MNIQLTKSEFFQAAQVGLMRRIASRARCLSHQYGLQDSPTAWGLDIEGACGELAAAKAIGVYWHGSINNWTLPDITGRWSIEVRTTARQSGRLIVRPEDSDESLFVHVTGLAPAYTVHGWISGADAKRPEWLHAPADRPAAYFVPSQALRPISDLQISHTKTTVI